MKKTFYLWLFIAIILGSYSYTPAQLIYGVTTESGAYNLGTIFHFSTGSNPNYTVDYSFPTLYPGMGPRYTTLVEPDQTGLVGELYGMTYRGGAYDKGVIFHYNFITNAYTKIIDFNGSNGAFPCGSLYYGADGMLYGMTSLGGSNDYGVLFSLNPTTEQLDVLYNFDGVHGKNPSGSLIRANDGKLYGLTKNGGVNDKGIIFYYDMLGPAGITKVIDLGSYGIANPMGSLMQASNGKLYGMSCNGGIYSNNGTLFEFTLGTLFTPPQITYILSFNGTNNGSHPYGSLIENPVNHKFYGMTNTGGVSNLGTLFECNFIDPFIPPTIVTKITFNGTNGQNPYGDLIRLNNGKLYGLTAGAVGVCGGPYGTLFEYNENDPASFVKYYFTLSSGIHPLGSLALSTDGKLYGMTSEGGYFSSGKLFQYDPNQATYAPKINFQQDISGAIPNCIVNLPDGSIYGTADGSTNHLGLLFQFITSSSNYTSKYDFNYPDRNPKEIIYNSNNNSIYGITHDNLFQFSFNSWNYGYSSLWHPSADDIPSGITLSSDNMTIYFMTERGGPALAGSIIMYNPLIGCRTLYAFTGGTSCFVPLGRLTEYFDITNKQYLYGMTAYGGLYGNGTIFRYDVAENLNMVVYNFNTQNGAFPKGSMIKANNGKLYGMTYFGGLNSYGVIFELDPASNSYAPKVNFATFYTLIGGNPEGTFLQASDGLLYGSTTTGGTYGYGTIFSFDYNSLYTPVQKIVDKTGPYKICDHLIEVAPSDNFQNISSKDKNIYSANIILYPNPASNSLTIKNAENANIQVYNMLGNKVMDINNTTYENKIDISSLPQGSYILKIMQNEEIITRRISVIK